MATKPKVLSDADIVTRVTAKSKDCVGWFDSRLSKERERVLNYYNGKLPLRQHAGSSSFVSTDVYDGVEMMKAQLLETFAGGDEIAQFDPDQDMGADDCSAATKYASYVIFRQNDGYSVFQDVIHDGLTARVGVAKVYWEEKFTYEEGSFNGLEYHEAQAIAASEDVDEFNGEADHTGLFSGTLTRKIDCSQVSILPVAPEEFLIAPRAISIPRSDYVGHRTRKTKAELIDMGYDKDKVALLQYDTDKGLDMSPEAQARHESVENGQGLDNPIQDEMQHVMLYESYVRMVIDQSKGVRLYKVCHVGGTMLDYEEVDKAPFIAYVPLPVPHIFFGNNFAARIIPHQNARTVLTRGVLDHTSITTNPRWQVVSGGLLNPKEMLENRLGGLVNVRRPDSVAALAYPNLNPFVFETLGMLKEDKEQSTGISSLSQGLNKDAISKQNSQGLVGDLVTLSGQRQKIAARNFANGFFVPLMLEVIRLSIVNEKKEKVVEVAGKEIRVNPQDWAERKTCTVSMHLGYGEKDKAVAKHAEAYKMLASDPDIKPMFTVQNRYELIRDTMKLGGLTGASRYITSPDKVQPPGPDPIKTKELEIKDKSATAALVKAQSDAKDTDTRLQFDIQKLSHDEKKMLMTALQQDREQDRKDLETHSRIDIAEREMQLAESAPAESRHTIVSAN
jgi:hypothetical protein